MYIGNQPAQSFATVTSQTINGNGGATYTLNRAVNNGEELEVFVNNVQQQPTVAYTASSTTLTFTENVPSATGNIYVIYRGLAQNVGQDENAPRLIGNNTLTGTQTINNKVAVLASDGTVDNDWVMDVRNDEQTDDRSFGLRVSAGSTVTDRALDVLDHAQANTLLKVNGTGFVSRPQTPCVSATRDSSNILQTISGTNMYVVTGLDSSYGNSYSVNNKSYFDSSTSRFTIPTGQPTGFYYCSFTTLMGIKRPSSGTNWGYIAIRKNDSSGLSNNHITEAYREVVNASGGASHVWETLNCGSVVSLSAGQWVEPIFSGSAGESMYIHSGTYTNFSVAQIG